MSRRTVKTVSIVSVFALAGLLTVYVRSHPPSDEKRWTELRRMARVAAVSRHWHIQPLASRYQKRYDATEKALLDSGYLVELAVPVRSSRTQCFQVLGVITNSGWPNAASRWVLDYGRDELRLTCRRADVFLWQKSLKRFDSP